MAAGENQRMRDPWAAAHARVALTHSTDLRVFTSLQSHHVLLLVIYSTIWLIFFVIQFLHLKMPVSLMVIIPHTAINKEIMNIRTSQHGGEGRRRENRSWFADRSDSHLFAIRVDTMLTRFVITLWTRSQNPSTLI